MILTRLIGRLIAAGQNLRQAPPRTSDVLIGSIMLGAGAGIIQRYVRQMQQTITHQMMELVEQQAELARRRADLDRRHEDEDLEPGDAACGAPHDAGPCRSTPGDTRHNLQDSPGVSSE